MDGFRQFIDVDNPAPVNVGACAKEPNRERRKSHVSLLSFQRRSLEELIWAQVALSPTELMWRPSVEDFRMWMRVGMLFVRSFTQESKDKIGRRCIVITKRWQ